MSLTTTTTSAAAFALLLSTLKLEGHAVLQSDADTAQLIADALAVVSPEGDDAEQNAQHLTISFEMIARDLSGDTGPECGHSRCSQNFIDTGGRECVSPAASHCSPYHASASAISATAA